MLLNRDLILQVEDLATLDVDVPEWGGTVRIRRLTGADGDAYEESLVEFRTGKGARDPKVNLRNLRARLVQRSAIGEDGKLLFGEMDVAALGKKSRAALDRVYSEAVKLNGMNRAELEEIAKNLLPDPTGASPSA